MKLNIIYGRSGTGKSEYIYKDISQKMSNNKVFLIVPEQSNLSAEKNLFDITNKTSLINAEVLTMSRMAYRVANEVGENIPHLSKAGKDMLIFDLLNKEKSNLNFLGKSEKNIEVVDRMLTELKKHNVSLDLLKNTNIENQYTNLKVKDIITIYEKYEEKLKNNYIDENDVLSILCENLDKTNMFNDVIIYIDDFLGFTKQEYNVFEKLLNKCLEINVTIPTDNLNVGEMNDIFYFNKKFANELIKIAEQNSCEVNTYELKETHRFKSEELKFLENNFERYNAKYNHNVENINLFLANNPYSEIERVGKRIHNLVKNSGYRYNEIGIIAEDTQKYSEDLKAIFNKYDIPLFVDEKKELNQNLLIKFIIAILDIFANNWSYEAVFNYLKIGLLDLDENDVFVLENYCRKWGIKGKKWYANEFSYEDINDKQEKLENIRKQIVSPLLKFKENISNNKSATQITKEIYSFLANNNIIKNLDKKILSYNSPEISDEYNTSYKLLISVLEDICLIFKDEKMSFDYYKNILQVGLTSSELGKIPATQDQVVFGDTERTRSNKLKVLFVIGINDGYFPKVNKQEGYLNDEDRVLLKDRGIELAKNSVESLYEEQFNIYRTLTTPECKLYLSYSSSEKDGASIRPSLLIKKIKRWFPNLIEESDIISEKYEITNEKATFEEALNVYRKYLDGEEIDENWQNILIYFFNKDKKKFLQSISGANYSNKAEILNKQNIEKLYGNILKTSVSRLEAYRRCPFSFHLKYGLKLKKREELKIEAIDTGSFMHEVIDLFFKEIENRQINIKEIDDDQVFDIVSQIISELLETSKYYIFTSSAKYRLLTRRLKKVVYQSILYIVYSLKYSDYSILGTEIEFSNNGKFKTINLDVDGKKIEITGKIDRLDVAKLADNQYVRIIDYKSSSKDLDLNQVELGLQIQLITYLDAVCDQTDFEASGVLYMGLIDNVVKDAKNMTEEEIERSIRNNFRMKGLVLADVSVIKMMDNKLQTGQSDIIPVYLTKDGSVSEKRSSVISKENFDNLKKQVKQIIRDISKEILMGKIDIEPYSYNQKTGCDYCEYKSICLFGDVANAVRL